MLTVVAAHRRTLALLAAIGALALVMPTTTTKAQSSQQTAQQSSRASAKAVNSTGDAASRQTPNRFMNIKEVKSPGGITAWLVESHNVPLMALRFAFEGGAAQDPEGKAGLAHFLTGMMDEGAGDLAASEFQERVEEIAMRMGFQATRDHVYGSFETLTVNRDRAVELLRLALTKPRFEPSAVERVKKQISSQLAFQAKDPERVAGKAWSRLAFGNHPYGRPVDGTPESVGSISAEDIRGYHGRVFARDTLKVVAVGDIDAKALGALLDKVFGDLPAKAELTPVPSIALKSGGALEVIEMPVPQSAARFGLAAMARKDPDFMAATVVNQILGGGGFASRLMEEVREKRGLAYGVYSFLSPMQRSAAFSGGVATKNAEMAQSLDVIKAEIRRMAAEGPTQKELDNAKSYLIGSYPLRFDTNAKIANELLGLAVESLGIDYINRRNPEIEAVTIGDAKRVAAKLLKVDDLIVTVVGKPEGLATK
jgi:zinc protease